jgi:hypothetical protein
MKTLLLVIFSILSVPACICAQGAIAFNNADRGPSPVTINPSPGTFNPADGLAGAFAGSNYSASLFYVSGTVTTQEDFDRSSPIWLADATFLGTTGLGPGHGLSPDSDGSGFFDGGTVLTPVGDFTFQVVAWYNGSGFYASYAQALAAGHNVGRSILLPLVVSPRPPARPLDGLSAFTVGIPEPSALVLAGLGSAFVLLLQRRGSSNGQADEVRTRQPLKAG